MENYKVRVKNELESKEAQELFSELGYKKYIWSNLEDYPIQINAASKNMNYSDFRNREDLDGIKKVTLGELRAIVSLHKNPINMDKVLSEVRSDALGLLEDKEYLVKTNNGYSYTMASKCWNDNWIEIPEGAQVYAVNNGYHYFLSSAEIGFEWSVLWKRQTHHEELPFVDDEPSLNDKYAEIEQVRREYKSNHTGSDLPDFLIEDTVNHPSHYAGEIECIDAMEAMLTPDQFIGYLRGNSFKYMWRYENKGGITDLEKAQWYLNKLISRIG